MAAKKKKRKPFNPRRDAPTQSHVYGEFMRSLLDGDVKAVKLVEVTRGGKLALDYDDAVEEEDV